MVPGETTEGWPERPLLARAFVDEHKRERCARALAEAAHEFGAENTTVSIVTKRAKVSRATFYALFENKQAALRYASELGTLRLKEAIDPVIPVAGPWEARVEAAIAGLLKVARDEPCLTELCLSGLQAEDSVAMLTALLAEAPVSGDGQTPGLRMEELLARGVLAIVVERLRQEDVAGLAELGGPLAELVTAPFRGDKAQGPAIASE